MSCLMSASKIPVYVGWLADKEIAEALLRPYPAEVIKVGSDSGAISKAQASLFHHPERPVAVLISADTEDLSRIEYERGATNRVVGRYAQCGPWYVAIAIPRLDAWAMTDPRLREALQPPPGGKLTYPDRAARIKELTQDEPFDATELLRTNADYKGLVDFLLKYAPAPAKGAARSSGS
jgi:hypothetical protein